LANQRDTPLLVGVDGGATEVKAHAVVEVADGWALSAARAAFRHEVVAGFAPEPIAVQQEQSARDEVRCAALELAQGACWIESFASAILSVAAHSGQARVVVGVCAPGLKSRDGGSLVVMRNGPRILDFTARLEARLANEGLVLARPIPPLLGDGFASGMGENASPAGGFRDVESAYFLGGGTGVAECFKLAGQVCDMDAVRAMSQKAWELVSSRGRSYEEHLSVRGLNARYDELGGDDATMPEEAALSGDPAAVAAFTECADMLAELVMRRVDEVRRARGLTLERVVVGQRLAALFAQPVLQVHLRERTQRRVSIPLHLSTLRAAPALGAALAAMTARSEGDAHAG